MNKIQFDATPVFESGEAGYHTIRIPALVCTPKGTLVAFAEARVAGRGDDGDIDLVCRRSEDGGRTWSDLQIVHSESGPITMGNPAPVVDRTTGDIVLLFTRNNEHGFVTRSTDDGRTFAPPTDITAVWDALRPDFDWQRIATGPVHGIQLKSGRLIVPFWSNDRPIHEVHEADFRCGTVMSDDGGHTWHVGQPVRPILSVLNECTVFERGDGVLHLNMRAQFIGYRCVATSDDAGETWSRPQVEVSLPNPTCQASVLRIEGDGDPLVLLSNLPLGGPHTPDVRPQREQLTIFISRDDGQTWPARRMVTPGPSGYSDLAQAPDGTLYILYENGDQRATQRISIGRFTRDWLEAGD